VADARAVNQVHQIVRLVDDVLGRGVIGCYLHGSAVLGGLKPASDVDVLVVCRRSLDDPQRRSLFDGLSAISGTVAGARPVELSVVVHSEVRPWRYPPTGDFLYGEWLRGEYDTCAAPQPMPDLAVSITTVLAGEHPLSGPPPAHILDPVPPSDLVRASLAGIPGLLEDADHDTRNVVLTFARIWTTLVTSEIKAKDTAADWALPRLPPEHRPVLAHAKEMYLHRRYSEETWSGELKAQVRPYVDQVLTEIHRLVNRTRPPHTRYAQPPDRVRRGASSANTRSCR
jgi:predicted nucleotidyltransferase